MLLLISAGPFTIYPGDSVEVALALVGGHDVASIYANAVAAKDRFDLCTDVEAEEENLPQSFALHQNYPNPFNPTTTIAFSLAQAGEVSLEVFNMLGQKVKTLFAGRLPKGRHTVEWDATNRRGEKVAGGVYFYRLTSAKQSQTRKMVLLK
jgi:methionine-rich copper-binding protein CopC